MWYPMFIPLSVIQIAILAVFIGVIYGTIISIKMPPEYYENQVKRREMLLEKFRKIDEEILEDEIKEQKGHETGG